MYWQESAKTERKGIREDVWFSIPEYGFDGDLLSPARYKVYTTWKIGPVELQRECVPAHTIGIPLDTESWVEAQTIWRFKIEWGDTWP